jgi:hypothetical protein
MLKVGVKRMWILISLFLLGAALVLFVIAARANPVEPWRGKLCCVAFACWVASEIIVRYPLMK